MNRGGSILFVRWMATAGRSKVTGKAVPAQKQQLMRRRKDAVARSLSKSNSASSTISTREALTSALFSVTNDTEQSSDMSLLEQRTMISKAWSRLQGLRLHAQTAWEHAFLRSKINSIQELEKVSPELAKIANTIDYSLPPLHRRIPTDTPPDPSKFPFQMQTGE